MSEGRPLGYPYCEETCALGGQVSQAERERGMKQTETYLERLSTDRSSPTVEGI